MGDKKHVGRPPNPPPAPMPALWESPAVARQLQAILDALEIPTLDSEARGVFQRTLHRQRYFGGDAKGQIIFTIRCITESSGNENALVGAVVRAVSSCLTPQIMNRGLAVIEAFDKIPLLSILQTMRDLDIFNETSIGHYFGIAIRNKLFNILGPAVLPKPAKPAKAKPKPPKRRPGDQPPRRMAA